MEERQRWGFTRFRPLQESSPVLSVVVAVNVYWADFKYCMRLDPNVGVAVTRPSLSGTQRVKETVVEEPFIGQETSLDCIAVPLKMVSLCLHTTYNVYNQIPVLVADAGLPCNSEPIVQFTTL
jgi:hypothetical protein